MAENCNSDPTSGCGGDGALVAALNTSNSEVVEKLTDIGNKLDTITTNAEECCEVTNGLLTSINGGMTTMINNSAAFYDALLGKLDTIAGLLEISAGVPDTPLRSFNISFASHVCVEVTE